MKRFIIYHLSFIIAAQLLAQSWKGEFYNADEDVRLRIDLYEASITAPNYDFLGKLNGYLTGSLYDAWFLTTFEIKGDVATCKFSNDLGSETQTICFSFDDNGNLIYETKGGNAIRRNEHGKWVKLPSKLLFKRKK